MLCVNTYMSYECMCATGYYDYEGKCLKITENDCNDTVCGPNATCSNIPAIGPVCICLLGFYGDGFSCVDIGTLPLATRLQLIQNDWSDDIVSLQISLNNEFTDYIIQNVSINIENYTAYIRFVPAVDEGIVTDLLQRLLFLRYRFTKDATFIKITQTSLLKRDMLPKDTLTLPFFITSMSVVNIFFFDMSSRIPCPESESPCHPARPCYISGGSMVCEDCNPGWTNLGYTSCLDINECEAPGNYCYTARECFNTAGSFYCGECLEPYQPTGTNQCYVPYGYGVAI